jgi:hypothetical protein
MQGELLEVPRRIDTIAKQGLLQKLEVWVELEKERGKVAFTFPLRDADLYTAPPGRLERPRTAPEAAALSAELRGQGTIAF